MKLADFHCRTVELYFSVNADEIDKEAFLKAAGEERVEVEDGEFRLALTSRDNPESQHAHMGVEFVPDEDVEVRFSFHDFKSEVVEEEKFNKPPYMEDCVQWLGGLIKTDKVKMALTVFYNFESGFAPSLPLPYPLLSSEKILSGAMVTGLAIDFPPECMLDHALLQTIGKRVGLSVAGRDEVTVKEFDLYAELKKLESTVMALTTRVEEADE